MKVFIFKATGRECLFWFCFFFFLQRRGLVKWIPGAWWVAIQDQPTTVLVGDWGEALENLRGGQ